MILNPLFLHLINSMTAHQNCLVGMHDTSYDTPLLSAYQRRCTDHLCVALWVFIRLFEKRGEVSNISAARCGHWRRPSWGVRTSSKSMCTCGVLSRPRFKKLVKFGTSFDDRSFQTGASHMKDHGFPKGDMSIQTPVAGDIIVWPHKNFPTVRNHQYTTCLIFWRIWGIISHI